MKYLTLLLACSSISAYAEVASVDMVNVKSGKSIGHVRFEDSRYGLLIKPNLHSLTPGYHGFHVHEFGDCGKKAKAAGGHLDPHKTNKHLGPFEEGHLGDLPALFVDEKGHAKGVILAPRLSVSKLKGRSIMIHEGGDNYSDLPEPLGGGGARIACGYQK